MQIHHAHEHLDPFYFQMEPPAHKGHVLMYVHGCVTQITFGIRYFRGGGTGLADPATVRPVFAVWCLKSQ